MIKSFLIFSFLYVHFAYSQELDSILNKHYQNKEFAGVVAGISIDGKITHSGQAGYANIKDSSKFSIDMHTRIASMVKPMTAIGIMQLVQKGKIKLEDPISNYIKEYSEESKSKITINQVMSHTSGIPGYKSKNEKENKKEYKNLESAFKIFKDRPLEFEPGTNYSYTSYGYVVLGILIERVSGESYAKYMQNNIWIPLSMNHTQSEKFKFKYDSKASLYHKENGEIKKAKETNISDRIPGGGVHSTLRDVLMFGEGIVLEKMILDSTFRLMIKDPGLKKGGNGYGLGLTLYGENPDLGPIYGHGGAQTGCSGILFIIPKKKAVIAVLSNTSGANKSVGEIAVELLQFLNKIP